jgi:hypothetical protein
MTTKYPYPFERIGNEANPKLIILLENPSANCEHLKWNHEYAMFKDGVYKKSGMDFSVVKEYESWWFELAEIWKIKFEDKDILSLEYYPYATNQLSKSKEIYPKSIVETWPIEALDALATNVEIIKREMKKHVPIFIYYKSGWFDIILELADYKFRSQLTRTSFRYGKGGKLEAFKTFIDSLL